MMNLKQKNVKNFIDIIIDINRKDNTMNNLLVGNGFLIQFGGRAYTNREIVLRTLINYERSDFPADVIVNTPIEAKSYFGFMFNEILSVLKNEYDGYCNCSAEREALAVFKEKYGKYKSLQISDIGFEDFYLIHDLICHKTGTGNPDQFYVRESLKMAFLHAIFNYGKIETVYKNFPKAVIERLKTYDAIFTTNYDNNIEQATSEEIYHIHGSFYEKADVYKTESFRNQISDCPIKDCFIDEEYFYLYSTAISFHCGEYKRMHFEEGRSANIAVEKMAKAYDTDYAIRKDIDGWKNDSNKLVANLYEAIQIKRNNPNMRFSEPYHIDKFENMNGHLDIIGLSPYNDFHIFEMINNSKLDSITFYYFEESECSIISNRLPNKNVEYISVKSLWEELK